MKPPYGFNIENLPEPNVPYIGWLRCRYNKPTQTLAAQTPPPGIFLTNPMTSKPPAFNGGTHVPAFHSRRSRRHPGTRGVWFVIYVYNDGDRDHLLTYRSIACSRLDREAGDFFQIHEVVAAHGVHTGKETDPNRCCEHEHHKPRRINAAPWLPLERKTQTHDLAITLAPHTSQRACMPQLIGT